MAGVDRDHDGASTSSLEEKAAHAVAHVEKKNSIVSQHNNSPLSQEDLDWLASFDEKAKSKIYHKVDLRLVPGLAMLYLIAHLDRANIGNAKIEGLEASLGMTGNDYNIALMLFFIPYVLCEVPSNMLLSKFKKPSHYIGSLVILWGIVMTCSGVTESFAGLCVTRFLIGFFEAGFFPGAIWTVSQWYPPNKTQGRMAMFYCASAASGAFSGLLAAGLAQMEGLGGYEGWRWIFLMEGIVSVLLGVLTFFFLPDSPLTASWLKPDEAKFLELSHIATRGTKTNAANKDEGEGKKKRLNWPVLKEVVKDWQLYLQALVFWSNVVPNYGLKFNIPTIITGMGFESTTAQLLSAPPYIAGAIAAVLSGLYADRVQWRMPFIVVHQLCVVVAFAVLFNFGARIADNVALCYVMVVLACIGMYPIIPGNNSWTINNLAGAEKRASGIAYMIMMGNCGGFAGSFIFINEEAPRYQTGYGSVLGFATAGVAAAFTLEFLYWRHNTRNAQVTEEEAREKYGEEKLALMGDKSPLFRYAL